MIKKPVPSFYLGNDSFTKKPIRLEDDFISNILCVGGMASGATIAMTMIAKDFLTYDRSSLIVADPIKGGRDFVNLLNEERVLESFPALVHKIKEIQEIYDQPVTSVVREIIKELTNKKTRTLFVLESFEVIVKQMKQDPELNSLVSWLLQCGPFYGIKVIAIYHSCSKETEPFLSSRIYNLFRQNMIFRTTKAISNFIFEDDRAADLTYPEIGCAFTLNKKVRFGQGSFKSIGETLIGLSIGMGASTKNED
jgi:hypothetical protein